MVYFSEYFNGFSLALYSTLNVDDSMPSLKSIGLFSSELTLQYSSCTVSAPIILVLYPLLMPHQCKNHIQSEHNVPYYITSDVYILQSCQIGLHVLFGYSSKAQLQQLKLSQLSNFHEAVFTCTVCCIIRSIGHLSTQWCVCPFQTQHTRELLMF